MVIERFARPNEDGYITPANPGESTSVPECASTSHPDGGYGCSREKGHAGPHAAHSVNDTMLATWGPDATR